MRDEGNTTRREPATSARPTLLRQLLQCQPRPTAAVVVVVSATAASDTWRGMSHDIRAMFGKKRASDSAHTPPEKQARHSSAGADVRDPCVLVSWNTANLKSRLVGTPSNPGGNFAELAAFVREHDPDVMCLQEVHLKAVSARTRSQPITDQAETKCLEALRRPPLGAYTAHWSLADKRHAGTAILVHRERVGACRVVGSLAKALEGLGATPTEVAALNLSDDAHGAHVHDPEGRVLHATFATFDVLNLYVPNRGWRPETIDRRRLWDERLERFLVARAARTQRPLIVCGDLNVTATPLDSTDEAFFRAAEPEQPDGSARASWAKVAAADRGIPGFSDNERTRFGNMLRRAELVDVWRRHHPSTEAAPPAVSDEQRERASYTWRGALRRDGNPYPARYEGKAQRLDYFLMPRHLCESRVDACAIHGRGRKREGFLGSDHCPVVLRVRAEPECSTPAAADSAPSAGMPAS